METSLKEEIRETYAQAAKATDLNPAEAELHLLGHPTEQRFSVPLQNKPKKMVETVNRLFHAAVETNPDFIFFGEDVEDPKGGVFKLTEGLSTKYPNNAFNSPVAESTILGVSCGLASYGKRPIAEIQHRLYRTGWNQLVSNIATLRWRTFGTGLALWLSIPRAVPPPGGGPWHSQSNEGDFARNWVRGGSLYGRRSWFDLVSHTRTRPCHCTTSKHLLWIIPAYFLRGNNSNWQGSWL